MNFDRLKELAAGFAAGELDTSEQVEFRAGLGSASPEVQAECARIIDAAGILTIALPRERPSASLRDRIMAKTQALSATPELFEFVRGNSNAPWIPMRVPGAFVKLLSIEKEKGYAVVLGKLDPGTVYPPHSHTGSEQIFVLSGDLQIGEVVLKAGDFHNAKAGSNHGENYSETGCTIMAIVSMEDLATLLPA